MIAVPWLIVNRPGGPAIFGYATAGITLVLVFLLPYYGWIIDRSSRKRVLLAGELLGLGATALFLGLAAMAGRFETWHLTGIYTAGTLYYTIHYPALFAFNQEIFAHNQYAELASVAEIQGQTASVISGALAALLIDRVDLWYIMLISTATYTVSWWLLLGIPYVSDPSRQRSAASAWSQVGEGVRYFATVPRFALFLLCAFIPFVGIMVGNYLFPIYTSQTLGAPAWVFGAGEVAFAFGAIGAGFSIRPLADWIGHYGTVLLTVGASCAAAAFLVVLPSIALYFVLNALLGWGNAGSRVARSTIMLQTIPNALIGRVNVLFNLLERLLRTIILSVLIARVEQFGAQFGFGVIALLTGAAWFGVLASRRYVPAVVK